MTDGVNIIWHFCAMRPAGSGADYLSGVATLGIEPSDPQFYTKLRAKVAEALGWDGKFVITSLTRLS